MATSRSSPDPMLPIWLFMYCLASSNFGA